MIRRRRIVGVALAALVGGGCGDDGTSGTAADTSTSGSTDAGPTSSTTVDTTTATSGPMTGTDASTGMPAECGNGVVEGDEQCDDGNTDEDDGCLSTCTVPPGEQVWELTHDGPSSGDDWANDVVVLPDGTILVAGYETTEGERRNLWLWALDAQGNELWSLASDYGEGLHDEALGITVDAGGDIWVAGYVERVIDPEDDDILYARLDPQGQEIWTQTFAGADGLVDQAHDIALVDDGAVVGGSVDTMMQDEQAWTRRIDAMGAEVWTTVEGGSAGDDGVQAIAIDEQGSIVVAGWSTPNGGDKDLWFAGLDAGGAVSWSQQVDGEFGEDLGGDVVFDGGGGFYVTGEIANALTNSVDLWLSHRMAGGAEDWTITWNSTGFDRDAGNGLALHPGGDLFVAGTRTEDNVLANILVGRFDTSGTEVWLANRDGGSQLSDEAYAVAVLPDDSIVVVGGVTVIGQGTDAWIARYAG